MSEASSLRAQNVSRESSRPAAQQPVYRGRQDTNPADDVLDALPTLLGLDELQSENDILYIANFALEAGIKSPAALLRWLDQQEMNAKQSRMWEEAGRYGGPSRGTQIAKYLHAIETTKARHGL